MLKPLRQHAWLIGGVAVILSILAIVCGQLYRVMVVEPRLAEVQSITRAYAEQQAAAVSHYARNLVQQLGEIGSNHTLASDLVSENTAALNDWRAVLHRSFPNAVDIQIVAAGAALPEQGNNFAALDLLRRTLNGEATVPEAVKVAGTWSLLVATAVGRDDLVSGAVLVSLPISEIQSAIATGTAAQAGVTQVFQSARAAAPQAFVAVGQAPEAIATARKDTLLPAWHVVFSAAPVVRDQAQAELEPFAVAATTAAAIALLLVALIVRVGLRRTHQNLVVPPRSKNKTVATTPQIVEPEAPIPAISAETVAADVMVSAGTEKNNQTAGHVDQDDIFDLDPPRADAIAQSAVSASIPSAAPQPIVKPTSPSEPNLWPESVFRNYDIRGLAGQEITPRFAEDLGKVLGSRVLSQGEAAIAVGADGRNSSPALTAALIQGLLSTGCDVIDLGQIPTPLLNFALHHLSRVKSGVMVTASHNPGKYNGFKFVLANRAISGDDITLLRQQMLDGQWAQGQGELSQHAIGAEYSAAVIKNVTPVPHLHLVLDCANGIAGPIAVPLLEALGCQVSPLYCEVDGDFPNHPPDPTVPAHLADLITMVRHQNAALGIALDGDGDRIVAVTATGHIVWPDELLMIFARDILKRHPGADVVYDVKSTRRLNSLVAGYGGRPVMWRTGHAHVRNKIHATGAPIGGEFSGHLFFNDRWFGFDDGLYAAARLLETLTLREQSLDELLADLEPSVTTPEIKLNIADADKFAVVKKIIDHGQFEDGKLITIDGLRVDFADGWGLVRASNTTPALTLRFEATTEIALARIKQIFREQLAAVAPNLILEPLI